MAKSPAFQFYVKDWLCSRRVLAMSGEAAKAYLYLLSDSWLSVPRATLPNDDKNLAQIARVSDDVWMRIKCDIMQHFKVGVCEEHLGLLYNEKLLEISRNYEKNQRPNNKNARRTRNKREKTRDRGSSSSSASSSASAKNTRELSPPSFETFRAYCIENGFASIAERAYKYYADSDWTDSQGRKVLSWKGKLQAVWFKDENRDKTKPKGNYIP